MKLTSSAAMRRTGQETSFGFVELGEACYRTTLTVKGTNDVKFAILVALQQLELDDARSHARIERSVHAKTISYAT